MGLISTIQPSATMQPVATMQPSATMQPVATMQPGATAQPQTATGVATPTPNATPQNVASVADPTAATPRTITGNETVAGQMTQLLNADSPYLQSARNRGMEQANQRGLINSSLAAGTAERAAIDAAAPIAQQDASTYATAGQSAQQANENLKLTGYKSLLDSAQAKENFGYQTAQNAQNIQANTDLQNARLASEAALQKESEQSQLQRQTQSEKAALQQQTQQQQATLQLQTQLKQMDINLDLTKLDATARDSMTSAVAPIIQQVQAEISQIQRTPDEQLSPTAKAAAIDAQNAYLKANLQTVASLYNYKLTWPSTNSAQQNLSNQQAAAAAKRAEDAANAAKVIADSMNNGTLFKPRYY